MGIIHVSIKVVYTFFGNPHLGFGSNVGHL